jgi:hypothetical protein
MPTRQLRNYTNITGVKNQGFNDGYSLTYDPVLKGGQADGEIGRI